MVLARIGDKVYGPFRADYEQRGRRFYVSLEKSASFDYSLMFDFSRIRQDSGYFTIKEVHFSTDARPLNNPSISPPAATKYCCGHASNPLQQTASVRIRLHSDEELSKLPPRRF
jgi:hypothetical protein